MTNAERRAALAGARSRALKYAYAADEIYERTGEDSPETNLASMWANVAQALKVGDAPDADGVIDTLT